VRALVIDDSRATRAILKRILQQLHFDDVEEAADGAEGLALLAEKGPVDVCLVDWNMPVLDGLGFVESVRAQDRFRDMRLIMVTTEGDTDHLVAALAAGADEYAMKPFTPAVIREKLELLGVGT
jgi:two-component system, chemotaxis family, chemotaxis protein CheY